MEPGSGMIETAISNEVFVPDVTKQEARPAICIVVAVTMTIEVFLLEQLASLMPLYEITLVANCPEKQHMRSFGLDLEIVHVPMQRGIAPLLDLKCLFRLYLLFRKRRFVLVHSITPKAGLLSMVAASLARVPIRVHTFTGQVWATMEGWRRKVLRSLDQVLAVAATHTLVDSRSQLQFLTQEKVLNGCKSEVLGIGSISGVDLKRFQPREGEGFRVRKQLDIPKHAAVFGFIGRIKKEKGVLDLARAFSMLSTQGPLTYLVIVGPDEEKLSNAMREFSGEAAQRIRFVEWTRTPEFYMAAFDVLCLPSYREGFGSVIIEAAACGVPALASRIYGISDAVVDGVTGLLHECGDVSAIAAGMQRVMDESGMVQEMGRRAQIRVQQEFNSSRLSSELVAFYDRILNHKDGTGA